MADCFPLDTANTSSTNKSGFMSTFSEDLDFFDPNAVEGTAKSANENGEKDEEKKEDENVEAGDEEEEEEDENEGEEVEDEGEEMTGNEEHEQVEMKEKCCGEKGQELSNQFSTDLWSAPGSTTSRSFDSWDLPSGTIPWDEEEKPLERLLSYANLTLTPEEEKGLLTDRIVAACSSYLTESPENKCYIAAKASLNNKNLNDIRILGYHRFLQYVDLSWNNLRDLTPLGCIPYLMYLDVSHNVLEDLLCFRPPLNLTYVNYSYNEVWQMNDLTDFWTLCYLDLSHNKISKIQGLHNLRYLRHLDLSYNKIERFENLNKLRLTDLNLEYNLISKFEMELGLGLNTMPYLTNLHLNNNLITSVEFLKDVYHLKKLDLQNNSISDLVQLTEMKSLKNLRNLYMSGNPVCDQKPYRSFLIGILQELKFLDGTEIDISERVASNRRQPLNVQLEAARNNIRMILLEQFNDTIPESDVLPVDQGSYPFVILVGPSASSKKYIMSCLAEKFPEKIHLGKLHTTRKVLDGEKHLFEHTTQENFQEMTKTGRFLCVSENLGHSYGFSRDELGKAIEDHKLCLTALDIVSALTIHGYGIRPFLVLTIPSSKEEHTKRLKMTYGPVLSYLGASYVAQRQLIDNHASNITRVQVILEDILKEVVNKASPGSIDCEECMREANQSLSTCNTGQKSLETMSNVENSSESVVHYNSSRKCYPCSPSKCGLQTCMTAEPDYDSSCKTSEECLGLTVTTDEVDDQTSTTSYSTDYHSVFKIETSLVDEFSYGEDDPFSDWSLPFVEWDEFNLTGLQLEEASELLCETYIERVMSTRDVYQNLHLDNPGLFSLCVFTDLAPKAVKTLTKFLKQVWRSTPQRKPPFDMKDDLVYQAFVPRKVDRLKGILEKDFLSSGDGATKELAEMTAAINSPSSVCREMRLKGYGDSFDE